MRHRRQLEQSAHQKLLVLLNVGGHDHQHIVGLAGGGVAAHNVRCGLHRRLEFGHGFVRVLGPTNHTIFKSIYFFDPNCHRLELAANTSTPEMMSKLDEVKWDMINEWSQTKRAPKHAAWMHDGNM